MLTQPAIANPARYKTWRAQKLADARRFASSAPVQITDPQRLTPRELEALRARITASNFAVYQTASDIPHAALLDLCRQLGLRRLVRNPFVNAAGISELQIAADAESRAYPPYDNRALNWHTDGYYNPPELCIGAFVLHCARAAADGGAIRLLDHEMLYLQLRDANPAFAECLFAPDVFTIPPGRGANGKRAATAGAVFGFADDRLRMAYTMRRRNIVWNSSPQIRSALTALRDLFADNPHTFARRLSAGEGVICNNAPHARAAFADPAGGAGRLVLRARFRDAVT